MDFEKDVNIDLDALEMEWLKQPTLYFKYSKQMEACADEMRELELQVDIIRSELDNEIRKEFMSRDEKKKLTEKMIEAMILQNSNYQKVVKEYNDKKYEFNILKSTVEALNQKKYALENLVKLWLGGYYATPKDGNRDWSNKINDYQDNKIVKNLNEKRR
jgi:hypothetical protein